MVLLSVMILRTGFLKKMKLKMIIMRETDGRDILKKITEAGSRIMIHKLIIKRAADRKSMIFIPSLWIMAGMKNSHSLINIP
jgi:hypothetical protein